MAGTESVIVRVPASTSNLGPGFDTLGLALKLYNDFTVRILEDGANRLEGRGTCAGLTPEGNPFFIAWGKVFILAGVEAPAAAVVADGQVPMNVGLGSSATARVAGALAANYFLGSPFPLGDLFALLAREEGHPDNVAPALFGGLTAAAMGEEEAFVHIYTPAATWRWVFLIPSYAYSTTEARAILPRKVALEDAAANLARVSLLIDALVEGDAAEAGRLLEDRLHEPYRKGLIRRHKRVRAAARKAGAAGTFISGSGPALGALCENDRAAERVLVAMLGEIEDAKFSAQGLILEPDLDGARLAEAD